MYHTDMSGMATAMSAEVGGRLREKLQVSWASVEVLGSGARDVRISEVTAIVVVVIVGCEEVY
jgi:hypothetical protein